MSTACTNTKHRHVDCMAAGLPFSEWCANCAKSAGPWVIYNALTMEVLASVVPGCFPATAARQFHESNPVPTILIRRQGANS